MFDGFEDTYSGAKTEVRTVHHTLVTDKRHHAAANLNLVGTEFGEFLRQHLFKTLESLGNEFKSFH